MNYTALLEKELIELFEKLQQKHTAGDDAQKIFMKLLFKRFNAKLFNSELPTPRFGLLKDVSAGRMRLRGRWWPSKKLLEMSPRTFFAPIEVFLEIFLHEMAHAATSEISKDYSYVLQGHGPTWQGWMRKIGLDPKRFDENDNYVYTSVQERKQPEVLKVVEIGETIKDLRNGGYLTSLVKADRDRLDDVTQGNRRLMVALFSRKKSDRMSYFLWSGMVLQLGASKSLCKVAVVPFDGYGSEGSFNGSHFQLPNTAILLVNDSGALVDLENKRLIEYPKSGV